MCTSEKWANFSGYLCVTIFLSNTVFSVTAKLVNRTIFVASANMDFVTDIIIIIIYYM